MACRGGTGRRRLNDFFCRRETVEGASKHGRDADAKLIVPKGTVAAISMSLQSYSTKEPGRSSLGLIQNDSNYQAGTPEIMTRVAIFWMDGCHFLDG